MRIAIDGLHLFGNYAGIKRSVACLVTALRRHAPEDQLILYVPSDFVGPPDADGDGNLIIRKTWFPGRWRSVRTLWRNLRLQKLAYREKCDLIHGPVYSLPWMLSKPAVVTIHDTIALTHPLFCTPGSARFQRRTIPKSIKAARRVIVPTIATKEALLTCVKEADEKRIDVIPWGVGPEFKPIASTEERRQLRAHLKLPEQFVLFVGNIEPKKNLPLLIGAFYAAKMHCKLPHKLIIAGQPGWKTEQVQRLIASHNAQEFILFTGYVSQPTLPALYALADLFVMPSVVEGFGMPALEAMACGCPVVISRDAALQEVCSHAACVFRYDADKALLPLREVLEELLADPKERHKMSAAGIERARVFNWERTARLTHECYERALE